MIEQIRMHPIKIVNSFISTLKNSFFIILFLFVIHFQDVATYILVGRILFGLFLIGCLIAYTIDWWKTTYSFQNRTIYIQRGLFTKKNSSIPFDKIQNIKWNKPFIYRKFNLTTIVLETSASDENATVKLEAVRMEEAEQIEQLVAYYKHDNNHKQEHEEHITDIDSVSLPSKERTIHFTPNRKDVIKASFLSFSFFAFIPILIEGYRQIDDVVNLDKQAKGIVAYLTSSWIITGITIILLVIIAVAFGMTHTYLKYGKYEIASDDERIYIQRGVLNEKAFSISKSNVQAIQINQGPLKKLLGLAEVKLISAGSEGEEDEISSLYPFLPTEKANSLIRELLPHFSIEHHFQKLPRNALYMRLLRIPWLWIIATVLLLWFKRDWYFLSPILFILTYMMRFFDYRNTRYAWDEHGIQFFKGGLSMELFVTNRKKVIEIEVHQNLIQKKLGLATIQTINRTKPYHLEEMLDVRYQEAQQFILWYQDRYQEIQLEKPY